MKRNRRALIIILVILMAFFGYVATIKVDSEYPLVKDLFIHSTESYDSAIDLAETYGLELIDYSEYGYSVFENQSASATDLLQNGFSYNAYAEVAAPPWQSSEEDPYLKNQYGLEITDTITAWSVTEGSEAITIAIIDTGIDIYHSEFQGRISSLSKNVVTDTVGLSAVMDDFGHGTMVAGIIGANKDNSIGIAGITQNTNLLVIKANQTGEGSFWDSDVIEGIYYAIEQGADVINLSLGSTYANPQTKAAIDVAIENDIVVVGASGNDGTDQLNYPASFDEVICVGAIGESYLVADYSNYGEQVDIAAPGSDILTTSIDGGYMYGSGTSFAAPFVTGIVALYMSVYPDASVDEIKEKLFISTMDLGVDGLDPYYGYGLINANDLIASTYYKITYVTFPGTEIEPDYVLSGTYLETTEIPTLTDSVFIGWYLDANYQVAFDNSVPITSDLTLYALFSDAYHTVRFVTDGSPVAPIVVENEATFTLPTTSLTGYRFLGWYLEESRTTLYQVSPVIGDLTLYAKFEEIIYYDVTYHVQDYVYMTESYEENTVFDPAQLDLYGYSFDGWFVDSELTIRYTAGPITSDLDLYASLIPETFQVTLVVDGSISIVDCDYLEVPVLTNPTKAGYEFAGWYLDQALTERYFNTPITGDLTLYAKFVSQVYSIDLVIFGEHYDYVYCEPGNIPYLPEISFEGYDFHGWFTDALFANAYSAVALNSDITLYGYYSETEYLIRFYDATGSLISSQSLTSGEPIVYPENPTKSASSSFDYTFLTWSYTAYYASESVDIYPVFERDFIDTSVSLNPAVDTIFVGFEYEDAGITVADSSLRIEILSSLDTDTVGEYMIFYNIYDNDEFVYSITRYIRVIEMPVVVEITLNPGISTIYLGEDYTESGATSNVGEVVITGTVDTDSVGVYLVTYSADYEGTIYTKTRVVTVLDQSVKSTQVIVALAYIKEEDYE